MQPVLKKSRKVGGRSYDLWTNCLDGVDWLCHCDFMERGKMTGLATLGYDFWKEH